MGIMAKKGLTCICFKKKLEIQTQNLHQHVEEDIDMNTADETIEESCDYGATLEPDWDPFELRRGAKGN